MQHQYAWQGRRDSHGLDSFLGKARVAPPKPGAAKRVEPRTASKKAASEKAREGTDKDAPAARKLVFALDEIDRARLVPKVEF